MREEAHPVAERLGIGDDVLLEFVEASLQWGDVGMRRSASAHRETEIRELERLAAQQAALRRVATMVASGSSPDEVFDRVAMEVGLLLRVESASIDRYEPDGCCTVVACWGKLRDLFEVGSRWELDGDSASALVYTTGRSARFDGYEHAWGPVEAEARGLGLRSAVASPILVNGRLWGAIFAATSDENPMPADAESRIAEFIELVATAISNVQARGEVQRLAAEQAALRRVATLVASGPGPEEVFHAVADEVHAHFGADIAGIVRFEEDGIATVMGDRGGPHVAGARVALDPGYVVATVRETGRAARFDSDDPAADGMPGVVRAEGIRSAIASPILVNGRAWGAVTAATSGPVPMPADAESRIAQFTELVATAVSNVQAQAEVERLLDEQAALRRVATLVAEGAAPRAVLDAVAAEMEQVLGADGVMLSRYEPDEQVTVLAHSGSDPRRVPAGTRLGHRGENVTSWVRRGERSARMEHPGGTTGAISDLVRRGGVRASVGAPIIVEGRLWGVALATWRGEESPPADTEERMAKFAELLETAIANADSRDQLTASRARLVTEADQVRGRVVRDLHDGAQQRLVHTIVTLKWAQQALRPK